MKSTQELPYTAEDLALVPRFVQNVGLARVVVISSNYFRDPIIDQHPELQMQLDINHKTTVYTDFDSKQAWANLELALIAIPNDKNLKDTTPFKIEATIEVRYVYGGKDLKGDQFSKVMNAFCHTGALSHAWSFFRQLVHDALSRMLLPPFMLPLYFHPGFTPEPPAVKPAKSAPKSKK